LIVQAGGAPNHRAYLRAFLKETRERLREDAGPNLSAGKEILIDRAISKIAILRAMEEHAAENGIFINGQVAPSLGKNFLGYSNSLRRDLEVLGIERKGAAAIDLMSYVREFDEQKSAEGKSDAAKEDSPAQEDVPDVKE
jgi:hypothetical protein